MKNDSLDTTLERWADGHRVGTRELSDLGQRVRAGRSRITLLDIDLPHKGAGFCIDHEERGIASGAGVAVSFRIVVTAIDQHVPRPFVA